MSHLVVTHTMPSIPAESVFAAFTDLARIPDFNRSCAKSAVVDETTGVGARARMTMYDGSEIVEEITSYDPATRRFGFDVEGVPAPFATMNSVISIDEVDGGCEVSFESEYTLKGGILGAALDLLMIRSFLRREHTKILRDLEHHLQTGELIGKGGVRVPRSQAA